MTEKLVSANLRNLEKKLKRVGEHSFMAQINVRIKLVLKNLWVFPKFQSWLGLHPMCTSEPLTDRPSGSVLLR